MSTRPRVVVTFQIADDLMKPVHEACEVTLLPAAAVANRSEFAAALADADGLLLSQPVTIDGPLLDGCPNLRVVSKTGAAYQQIDVPAATARGVLVSNTPGVLNGAVADHTFALLLALARRLRENEQHVRSGAWLRGPGQIGTDVRGKTLGIIGLGGIGRTVAQTARGFSMPVLYYKPRRDPEAELTGLATYRERDDLLRESDVVSLHCPLNDQTRGSIGARELSLMKPTAYLINMSRGAVVDQDALATALQEGRIAGAALDVTEPEPLDPTHPLCQLPNVVLTPHIGSGTTDARYAMHALAVRNLLNALRGDLPETPLNPDARTASRR